MNIESSYEEIVEFIPIMNNNIIEFRKIVNKLNQLYRHNRISIMNLENNINCELEIINKNINELKILSLKKNFSNLSDKIDNSLSSIFKSNSICIVNIVITSLLIYYLT